MIEHRIPGLSPTETDVWRSVIGLTIWLPAALDLQLNRDAGISNFEYGVLSILKFAGRDSLRMTELARMSNSTLPRLSKTVLRLERAGWVRRDPDPDDGRVTRASLTDAGVQKILESTPDHVAFIRTLVLDKLSARDLQSLGRIAEDIVRAAGPDGACSSRSA